MTVGNMQAATMGRLRRRVYSLHRGLVETWGYLYAACLLVIGALAYIFLH